jgi:phosphomannomutase
MMKNLIAFDMDDTLAITKSPISDKMSELFVKLLETHEVCVISGGKFEQFKLQLIDRIEAQPHLLKKLHIMPTCGTRYYLFEESTDKWVIEYAENLSEEQKAKAVQILEQEAKKAGIWVEETYGDIIEDRGSQITYSALGQLAPPDKKYEWAEKNKDSKKVFRDNVAALLPELEVRLGGTTSVDITRPGIDKAYGMQKLIQITGFSKDEILFVGDKLEEGGNDYPVKAMGVDTIAVEKWEDTALVIEAIIKTA